MFSARFPACFGYGRHQKSFKPQWLFYMFPHVKKMFDVTGETKPTRWDPDVCQDVFLVSPKLYDTTWATCVLRLVSKTHSFP